jgi:hypothetical protein
MTTLNDDQLDRLGQISDTADNCLAASNLPVSTAIHLEGMREALKKIRDEIRGIYLEASGENPWEEWSISPPTRGEALE